MSRFSNIVISSTIVIFMALAFAGGFLLGQAQGPAGGTGLDVINEAWDIVNSRYVEKDKLNSANMSRAAIEGIIDTLNDPYTGYLTVEQLYDFATSLQGEYPGIGTYVTMRDGNLTILATFPDSPAEKAGLKSGDIILEIDGEPIAGLDLDVAANKLRGPADTTVRLLILHADETEPVEVELTRAIIELPSVVYEMREDIAYITIFMFTGHTDAELTEVIQELEQDGAKGIILDIRNNGGGLLDAATAVASHFLESGTVAITKNDEGTLKEYYVDTDARHTDLPIVVLVNENTASAAEVLAGALQDYGRAVIAGNTTYGKGSATGVFTLADGSALNITIARWFTPNGRLIEGNGIAPDIRLELTGDDAVQWAIDYLKSNNPG
jgi:carboxyl-terminal processing protease